MKFDRRRFMKSTVGGMAAFGLGGHQLSQSILGGSVPFDAPDKVLLILELSGGNDGLNTIVPFADDAYAQARPKCLVDPKTVLKIDDYCGFNPRLEGFKELYGKGQLAIVQGVGYPDPVRSHFKSFDIWHAADHRGRGLRHGWVGRMMDQTFPDVRDPNAVIHIGSKIPFSLNAAAHPPVAFTAPTAYRWIGSSEDVETLKSTAPVSKKETPTSRPTSAPGRDRALARIRRILHKAQSSSAQVRALARDYKPKAKYPRLGLSGALSTVAALIVGGMSTRVYSMTVPGFDTHTNHLNRHNNLMTQIDGPLAAFQADLDAHGLGEKVTTVVFSEFGRRVAENGSEGLDHGVAGPMFIMGGAVKGGLFGKHPSLTDLDDGDLKHATDFRSVYASIIDDWVGGNHKKILGKEYSKLELFNRS